MSRLTARIASIKIEPASGRVGLDLGFGPNSFGAAQAAHLIYGGPERLAEIHGYGTRLSGALVDLLRTRIGDRLLGVIGPVRHLERELSLATSELLRERASIEEFRVNLVDGGVTMVVRLERGQGLLINRHGNNLRVLPTALTNPFGGDRAYEERITQLIRREIPAISNAMSQVRLFVPLFLSAD
jgi:hypothetical protein